MVIDLLEKALRSRTGVVWVSSVDLFIMNYILFAADCDIDVDLVS